MAFNGLILGCSLYADIISSILQLKLLFSRNGSISKFLVESTKIIIHFISKFPLFGHYYIFFQLG